MRTNGDTRITTNGHDKSPAQIEREIEVTRARMEETLEAIRRDLSPGQLVDHAIGYLRAGKGSDVMSGIGNIAKENPMPVALVGLGITWLAVSSMKEKREATVVTTTSFEGGGPDAHGAGRVERAKERLHDVSSRAKEKTHSVRERASHMSDGARERARSASVKARSQASRAKDGFGRAFEDNPLLVGAAVIGIGALLGAALPASRREDRLMGKKRDDLVEKASELSAQKLEEAEHKLEERSSGTERREDVVETRTESFGSAGERSPGYSAQPEPSAQPITALPPTVTGPGDKGSGGGGMP